MNNNRTNGLSTGGMVVGIIALLVSFIPCIGVFGGVLAIVGLILSLIGYRSAKDTGGPTGIGITGMVLSGIAIVVAVAWGAFLNKARTNIAEPLNIETCDEALVQMEEAMSQITGIKEKGEDTGIGDVSILMKATTQLVKIRSKASEMECSQDSTFKARMDALEEQMGNEREIEVIE